MHSARILLKEKRMIRKKGNVTYHISAGGYVLNGNKVLLVKNLYHGGIIPPHGHLEKGESLIETAQREICEETGYCFLRPIFKISIAEYSFKEKHQFHHKKEHRWVFKLAQDKKMPKKTDESESLRNRWYTIDEAIRVATFENTRKDLLKIKEYLRKKKG